MRRALLALGGTAAGIAALVAVKFHPAGAGTAAAGLTGTGVMPSATGSMAPPAGGAKPSQAAKPSGTAKPAGTATSAAAGSGGTSGGGTGQSAGAQVFTGAVANTQYGPMQVQITVAGKKITKAVAVQQTNLGGLSQSIDAMAIPQLNQETLTAQSANINAVSGASYTSSGYKQSLQSAIDKAGL